MGEIRNYAPLTRGFTKLAESFAQQGFELQFDTKI
jgi:hypothetical protein